MLALGFQASVRAVETILCWRGVGWLEGGCWNGGWKRRGRSGAFALFGAEDAGERVGVGFCEVLEEGLFLAVVLVVGSLFVLADVGALGMIWDITIHLFS